MSKSYSTKELCEIFGIGRETLRHYENIGLLHPQINPQNGYREYGYWDVGVLVDTLKFRTADYSLKEVKEALFDFGFFEVLDVLEVQRKYYQSQILRYEMMEEKVAFDLKYLRYAIDHFNEIHENRMYEMFYVPYANHPKHEYFQVMKQVFNDAFFFSTAWILKKDDDKNNLPDEIDSANEGKYEIGDNPLDGIGFVTEKKYAQYLGITKGIDIPACKVVGSVIDIKGKQAVVRELFEDFEDKVMSKYDNASRDTFVILMSRFHDTDGELHQYVYAYKVLE